MTIPVIRILGFEMRAFLYVLAAIVAYQMLTGRINLAGLLCQKGGSNQTSPERVQLLLATLAAAARYLGEVAQAKNGKLPDIGNDWLYLMGGSGGLYLVRKAWVTWQAAKNFGRIS